VHDDNGPNFTTFEFTSNGGGGRMMFSTRTWRNDSRNVRSLEGLLGLALPEPEDLEDLLTDWFE
jgi:hypothetical protein